MLRAVLALTGTVAGLAALLTFKSHSAAIAAAPPATPPVTSQASGSPTPTSAATTRPAAGKGQPAASKSPAAVAARTVTGAVANTQYGPMQVKLTLTGQQITKVTILQQTNDGGESSQIDSSAIPKLTSETLAAQSAKIDAVSGASYTSMGYIQSLQSALDQAK